MNSDIKSHTWALLLTAHATLVERIEAAMAAAELPPLAWYDVLWELEKSEGGLRMHDLARRVVLSRSNLSRLADRLEDARLIEREDCHEDGRGYNVVLTRAGRAMRKKMWSKYETEIERVFFRHITTGEAHVIVEALARTLKAVGGA